RASLEGAGILDVDISAGAAAVERAVGLLEPALSEDAVRAGACGVDVGIQVHADGPAGSLRSAALVQAPLDRRQNTVDRVLVVAEQADDALKLAGNLVDVVEHRARAAHLLDDVGEHGGRLLERRAGCAVGLERIADQAPAAAERLREDAVGPGARRLDMAVAARILDFNVAAVAAGAAFRAQYGQGPALHHRSAAVAAATADRLGEYRRGMVAGRSD